ncbi:hypothetical protein SKAU_G00294520 [Synaphobranchus kaupii]|uniref:Uncharacterized protein n=1 Tax=Synaphobranchus kaupii TaxID=118154 RepID=A0A9Q1EUI7_SYNKA|nr:hypothetical protein SKAU_G00294520 [Synaphobranchus kaupii]
MVRIFPLFRSTLQFKLLTVRQNLVSRYVTVHLVQNQFTVISSMGASKKAVFCTEIRSALSRTCETNAVSCTSRNSIPEPLTTTQYRRKVTRLCLGTHC